MNRAWTLCVACVACGAAQSSGAPPADLHDEPFTAAPPAPTTKSAAKVRPQAPAAPPSAAEIFAAQKSELVACYDAGRRAIPTMTSGKVTYHVAASAAGRASCVVPSDDVGLTQEVEDCMRASLEKASYARTEGAWSQLVPIVVRDSIPQLGEPRTSSPTLETIESHGMSDDIYEVIEGLLPKLYACTKSGPRTAELRTIQVGGVVGADGRVTCALASSPAALSPQIRDCAANVLREGRFAPPKKGSGLVSVPLNVLGRQ